MKLVIQIPCYNEAETIRSTLADLPKRIKGINSIEVLIIDDGSTDDTVKVARRAGVKHFVSFPHNRGLASGFSAGLSKALSMGADIIVNTDADNQYRGADIPRLVAPILEGKADIVIGNRNPASDKKYPPLKRVLYKVGSCIFSMLVGKKVVDPVSGFRAMTAEAAKKINVLSQFSYTTEMLLQAYYKRLHVVFVDIKTNPTLRESRLFSSIGYFLFATTRNIVHSFVMYRPLAIFFSIGVSFFLIGAIPIIHFLMLYIEHGAAGHIQSLVLGTMFVTLGFISCLAGLVAKIVSYNRFILERCLEELKQ